MSAITDLTTADVRFPTSRELDGSDAMNPDPDYSAAYVTLHTDGDHQGVALVFTEGRGNEIVVKAMESLRDHVVGRPIDTLEDVNAISRLLIGDSHLRWLGPEKGVMHMAIGAVVNAAWDVFAKQQGKPLWLLLGELTPEELVSCIDFRYLTDAITPERALELLTERAEGKAERIAQLREHGFPAYTTTPGWLGYSDEKLVRLSHEAVEQGFSMIKLKVGGDLAGDRRRLQLAREAVGADVRIGVDANQIWDVPVAIEWMTALAEFNPYWIEEPTSPDDVLGHRDIRSGLGHLGIKVATGEHCQNRIITKQLMASGAIDIFQLDSARMGGVNELLAVLLLALRFDIPVIPHAGGVGLCEMVQHYAMADFVAFAGTTQDRYVEYIDHLHEHFTEPVRLVDAAYVAPSRPGNGAQMLEASIAEYRYPDGPVWAASAKEGSGQV